MIIGIVAIAKSFAIGKDGKLPWHYSADLKFFKETTSGNVVVMGTNTWRSIGKALPNRLNIVLSRSREIDLPVNVIGLHSIDEVVELSKYCERDIYIIGGAKIYEAFSDVIDKWVVTDVPDLAEDADTFLPANFLDGFEPENMTELGENLTVRELRRR